MTKELPEDPRIRSWILSVAEDFVISDQGLLYWMVQLQGDERYLQQLYVPKESQDELLDEAHSGPITAHSSSAKMLAKLQTHYYWPGIRQDVMRSCYICLVCVSQQGQGRPGIAPLTSIPPTLRPME